MSATDQTVIEGDFRVVATRELPTAPKSFRSSPNRRRAAARIVFWNVAVVAVAVGLPLLMH